MLTLNCHQPTFFDVDDTLVKFEYANVPGINTVEIICDGQSQHLIPHKKHIERLKAHKARGHTVVVWSQGGHRWAEAVVVALGLTEFVDLVLEKPMWAYDDLPAEAFIGKTQFLKDE